MVGSSEGLSLSAQITIAGVLLLGALIAAVFSLLKAGRRPYSIHLLTALLSSLATLSMLAAYVSVESVRTPTIRPLIILATDSSQAYPESYAPARSEHRLKVEVRYDADLNMLLTVRPTSLKSPEEGGPSICEGKECRYGLLELEIGFFDFLDQSGIVCNGSEIPELGINDNSPGVRSVAERLRADSPVEESSWHRNLMILGNYNSQIDSGEALIRDESADVWDQIYCRIPREAFVQASDPIVESVLAPMETVMTPRVALTSISGESLLPSALSSLIKVDAELGDSFEAAPTFEVWNTYRYYWQEVNWYDRENDSVRYAYTDRASFLHTEREAVPKRAIFFWVAGTVWALGMFALRNFLRSREKAEDLR